VREALLALPGGASEAVAAAELHSRIEELQRQADTLEGRAVPRPAPPQYARLAMEAAAFIDGAGAPHRVLTVVAALEVACACFGWTAARPFRVVSFPWLCF